MQKIRVYSSLLLCAILVIGLTVGCDKEYSYEGGAEPPPFTVPIDTTKPVDTVYVDPGQLPNCNVCNDSSGVQPGTWSFKTGRTVSCGQMDTAIILSLGRNSFTFFGPSFCGQDTGLIFTVNIDTLGLNANRTNVLATKATFYYYHTNFPFILYSHADQPFTLLITHYDHATKRAVGIFSGSGYRQDGRSVNVSDGKFNIQLL